MNVPKLRFKDDNGQDFPEWEEKTLGEITSLIKDGTHGTHQDTENGEYLLLSAKNIKNGRICYDDSDRRIDKAEFETIYKNYKLHNGDVLLSVVGTIGRVAIYSSDFENVAFQRSVAFFRFKNENSQFMAQLFSAKKFQNDLLLNQVVSAQPGVYLGDLAKIYVNLPSLPEQTKIANFLSAVDDKIAELTEKVALLQRYKKGAMQQIFSQQLRFKDDNGQDFPEWEEKSLNELRLKIIDGDRGLNYPNGHDFCDNGFCLFLNAKNVTKSGFSFDEVSFISEEKDRQLRNGKLIRNDLILTTRGTVGNIAYFDHRVEYEHIRINSGMIIIRSECHNISSTYLYQYFYSPTFRKIIDKTVFGSAQPQLTVTEIKKFKIGLPIIQEQTKIANFLSALDEQINTSQQQLDSSKQYKQSLLQQMFI